VVKSDENTTNDGQLINGRMNQSAKNCRVLELLVLLLLVGEGLLFARSSFAFVANESSSSSIVTITTTMSTASNDQEAAIHNFGKPQLENPVPVPLIDIGTSANHEDGGSSLPPIDTSRALVRALQDSGFALVRSPLLTRDLQSKALEAASRFLATPKTSRDDAGDDDHETPPLVDVLQHPTDPKVYSMLNSDDEFQFVAPDHTIQEYVRVLRRIKMDVLRLIAIGLGVCDTGFFAKLHDEHNDTLRLITYFPTLSEATGNRCKEHSDYGTITLLSTDGVSGLELFHDGRWLPVPFVEGTLVVNVGSLLAGWTKGSLRATLHRVAGPASSNSCSDRRDLLEAVHHPRTSLAFFADPNRDVSESLAATATETATETTTDDLTDALGGMSVAEYMQWRSGGDGAERSGVSFTAKESEIIHNREDLG